MRKRGFVSFPLIIIIIVIGVAGYLSYQNFQQRKSANFPIVVSPKSSPSSEPTNSWKTYTNKQYDYSFKYPPQFKITERSIELEYYRSLIDPDKFMSITTISSGSIEINISFEGQGLDSGFHQQEVLSFSKTQESFYGYKAVVSTYILGTEKKSRICKVIDLPEFHNFRLVFVSSTEDIEIVNQILSTFKFTQ